MNSIWLVITALAAFAVSYRLYGAFLAAKVAVIDDRRTTPAHRLRDGVDYHPTKRLVLFGHHFAAIAGPGPLIGPVLASQWGYAPGFAWIVIGACLAGGVHDFVTLVASVRQDGLSLPKLARNNLGVVSGVTTAVATLFIVVAVLSSVAMVVVNALSESSWGMFTIIVTIPAALLTGWWMYKFRPGRVGEASIVGVSIVMLGVILGKPFADYCIFADYLVFEKDTLKLILPTYAAIASILPVWVLMCPRDYLSSYMKIGVVVLLAAGIICVQPDLKMPATTPFLSGGPVVQGTVWPFVCIVIMCGALSGFHALIASGTTPKMINKETDMRPIGYGAMILEGCVSIMALVAACALDPSDYFKINIAQDKPHEVAKYNEIVEDTKARHHWDIAVDPDEFADLERAAGEQKKPDGKGGLAGKVGGAVTLAVGMAKVFTDLPGMSALTDYWYHFVIMFEALFILTLLETGTRVARFVFQETLAQIRPEFTIGHKPKWALNVLMSVLVCGLWGGLLYIGNLDVLWRMLGIANQLLATIALVVGTTYLLKHTAKRRYALCTGIPLVFVVATVFTAGVLSIGMWWKAAAEATTDSEAFMARLAAVLAGIMLALTAIILVDAVRKWYGILTGEPQAATAPAHKAATGGRAPE